jgi:hypothetical protein
MRLFRTHGNGLVQFANDFIARLAPSAVRVSEAARALTVLKIEDHDLVRGYSVSALSTHTIASLHAMCLLADLGNNADGGQFVLGQPKNKRNRKTRGRLPTVAELFPEIVTPLLDNSDNLPACSAVEALERQQPFINQTLAYHALAMLARLFRHGENHVPRRVRQSRQRHNCVPEEDEP